MTADKGNQQRLDYSSTKGGIVAFTRSLSQALIEKGIRVNGVAPGRIWTPLIPSTFPAEKVETFGQQVPMARAGQPEEIAPCYVGTQRFHKLFITAILEFSCQDKSPTTAVVGVSCCPQVGC